MTRISLFKWNIRKNRKIFNKIMLMLKKNSHKNDAIFTITYYVQEVLIATT